MATIVVRIICEFDGDYWHGRHDRRSKQYRKTLLRTNTMLSLGYVVIHVWHRDYEAGDLGVVLCKDARAKIFAQRLGVKFIKTRELEIL